MKAQKLLLAPEREKKKERYISKYSGKHIKKQRDTCTVCTVSKMKINRADNEIVAEVWL